ncbi:hypothetical protein [Streptomyces sp. NBC_01497]|uniref:hypothetical protein n=1 Tax=Streptomyces sp. NBC_01497 TaxID=2903885 RepID=UPI002E35EA01|nr:hypothetical protein [Streptomyces sp. NBC_01497]
MTKQIRRISALVTAGVSVAALATVLTGTAEAATPCTYDGRTSWYCHNVVGATVYAAPDTSRPVGTMNTNPSWFECRTDNGAYVGGPHPYRWLWTEADNGEWGYMKDTDISSETDPLPTEIGNGIPVPC